MTAVFGDSRLPDRFWAKVQVQEDGCWQWTAAVQTKGYSVVGLDGKVVLGHRAAYLALKGEIPQGLMIDHLCRNRRCVNPEHMEVVNNRTNSLRGDSFAAVNAKKETCPKGHPLTRHSRKDRFARFCHTCAKASTLAHYHRTKKLKGADAP